MGRIILVLILMGISGIIYLVKAGASKVTGREVNFQEESQRVMEKTARGVNWMNEQWEKAKSNAREGSDTRSSKINDFDGKRASDVISIIRDNPYRYNKAEAEAIYIELSLKSMQSGGLEDAKMLAYQVLDENSRMYLLDEIASKQLN